MKAIRIHEFGGRAERELETQHVRGKIVLEVAA